MALAIVLGALAGALGFAPLLIGLRLTKKTTATSPVGPMAVLLLALVVSFVLVFVLAIAFVSWDKPHGLPFVLAEVLCLCAVAIGYGIHKNLGGTKKP